MSCTINKSKLNINVSNDNIITTPGVLLEPKECIGRTIFTHMKARSDQIAQIDSNTGKQDTFGELLQRSIRVALHISSHNITREHTITLCTKNHLNAAVSFLAAQLLGIKISTIDPSFSSEEMKHFLNILQPRMIFTMSESVPVLEKITNPLDCKIVVFDETDKHFKFSDFLVAHKDEQQFEPVDVKNLRETAMIYFSSGTTGLPKGICLSHYSILGQLTNQRNDVKDPAIIQALKEKVSLPLTLLCYTSLYWISGAYNLLDSIIAGYRRLVCDRFDGKEAWNHIQKYKPAIILLTPIHAIELLDNKRTDVETRNVLQVIIIGSSISKHHHLDLRNIFPDSYVFRGYGQTEVGGSFIRFNSFTQSHRELINNPEKIGSVGLPTRGVFFKVADVETNKNLGPNQQGELRIKTKFMMNGYYKMDSSDTFDEDGWLKTGDVVFYDEDYCFYVVDRIKEAFKYQGWFIAPVVLEDELLKHPAVKFAVVIGIPKDDGHHAMGLVILNKEFRATEEEIKQFVNERVPERQKLRAGVKIIDSLPLTVSGKVKRRELKQMVLDGTI